jgi:hypothetical protein
LNELQQQLQAALGNTCRLERELGGGGMSGFFVAPATALVRAYDAAGNAESAIAWGERYLAGTSNRRITTDWREMPAVLIRMGDLSADKGDRAKAAEYYQKYIDLRREADPSLQPQVAEVKQKLAEVAGEKK